MTGVFILCTARNLTEYIDAGTEGIRYLADLTLSNFRYLLREVATEVLACNDAATKARVLPDDTRPVIFKPHELNKVSEEFYKSRIEEQRRTSSSSSALSQQLSNGSGATGQTSVKLKRQSSSSSIASLSCTAATSTAAAIEDDNDGNCDVVIPSAGKGKRGN